MRHLARGFCHYFLKSNMNSLPDWKLPVGTSRGLWAYLTDSALADDYDRSLAGTALLDFDLRRALELFRPPGSLADLGCGTARLLIPFARLRYPVMGVDLSQEMLRVARHKAIAVGLEIPLIRANLVELDGLRDHSFDYAACLFSTLGMVSGIENRRRVLAHAFRILKPGGRFLLHVHNLWFHLQTRAGRHWLLVDRWRNLRGAADAGYLEMPSHRGIAGLALYHFSRGEIIRELKSVGFVQIGVEPVSLRPDCRLPLRWLFPGLRAYGFLVSAIRPES